MPAWSTIMRMTKMGWPSRKTLKVKSWSAATSKTSWCTQSEMQHLRSRWEDTRSRWHAWLWMTTFCSLEAMIKRSIVGKWRRCRIVAKLESMMNVSNKSPITKLSHPFIFLCSHSGLGIFERKWSSLVMCLWWQDYLLALSSWRRTRPSHQGESVA